MNFIAEIGLNHNGSEGLLIELIRQAAKSGATMAKFQLGWRDKPDEINFLDSNKLKLILKVCTYYRIEPLFSIFHKDAWNLLSSVTKPKMIKIASRTFKNDLEFVKNLSRTVEQIIVSTGMSDKKNIDFSMFENCHWLWCESIYPLLPFQIKNFPSIFNNKTFIGLSDHSQGLELSLLAISRGAKIIERHFTLDKSDQTIRDHALSSSPDEFAKLVEYGNSINDLIEIL